MLKHEDSLNESSPTAAQTRVKTEEFAHAIATLEAKKLEEARRLEGTVVLGEAVTDLQIEIAPEEILAEVEQNRREAAQPKIVHPQNPLWPTLLERRFTWPTIASLTLAGFVTGWLSNAGHTPIITPAASVPQYSATNVVISPPAPPAPLSSSPPVLDQKQLSQIPDEQQVYCTQGTLMSFHESTADPVITTSPDPLTATNSVATASVWPLIKHKDVLYVRIWVPGHPSANFLEHRFINAFLTQSATGVLPSEQITFPVAKTIWGLGTAGVDNHQNLDVLGVRLDTHAYEKW